MKRIIFLIILTQSLSLQSCSKEKFENDRTYLGTYYGVFEKNDGSSVEHSAKGVTVLLNNETKNTIEYNGHIMEKKGRSIEGNLPDFSLFGV